MAEDFDNLLSIHHFLNISVNLSKIHLLFHEIFSTLACRESGRFDHERHHNQGHNRKRNIQDQHTDKYTDDRKSTVDHLRNTLADHLSQRVDVVRIDRHDISMSMRVKIPDRQFFHMFKQIISQIPQRSLRYIDHDPVIQIGTQYSQCVEHGHSANRMCKRSEIRRVGKQKRRNVVIDQVLGKHGSLHICKHTSANE